MNCKVPKDSEARGPSSGLAAPTKPRLPANPKIQAGPTSSKQAAPYSGTSAASSVSARPATPAAEIPKPAPKKGSYAEIMARAKAAQTTSPAVGVIKHKPKEKLSEKKELLLAKKGLSAKGKVVSNPRQRGQSSQSKSASPALGLPSSKKLSEKKVAQPVYKGTAKPAPAYRGTMKAVPSTASSRKTPSSAGPSASKSRHNRYAASSDDDIIDDEEIDEEDEEDYPESESDMEAGFSDVEEEEQMAVKAAKKEDDEQARIEDEHKKEKEERRRMLQRMANNAKKRSY